MKKTYILLVSIILSISSLKAQLKEFEIAEMPRPDVSIVQANIAYPEDALIIVYSSLDNLSFRSSMGGIDKQNYNSNTGRYELLIKPIKQMLFVGKLGFLELKMNTLNPNEKEVIFFKVEEHLSVLNSSKGILTISSVPEGADIYINNLKLSDKTPTTIEYPSGSSIVKLVKSGFIDKDTLIRIKENNKLFFDFILQTNLPIVKTFPIDSLSSNSAFVSGQVLFNGGSSILEQGICWSKNPNPTLADNSKKLSFETNRFNGIVSELRSNYTYYFRAFAINKNGISYGNEVIVKTIVSKGSGYVSDIDGNVYSTINIGDQVWMADNLKTSRYANGDLIPQTKSNEKWAILESGSWCNYNNLIMYDKIYGKLYNWFTVSDSRNVCPIDWHVPSDIEWLKLTDSLGGVDFAGGKMKTIGSSKWQSPNSNATNESGFSALPGGDRRSNGEFAYIGNFVSWWCASEDGISNALFRYIGHKDGIIYKSSVNKLNGFSIRCIKD